MTAFFRHRTMRAGIIAAVALVTAGATTAGVAGLVSPSILRPGEWRNPERALQVGQSVQAGHLTLTLTEAQFSGTRSIFTFHLSNDSIQTITAFAPVMISADSVSVKGVAPIRSPQIIDDRMPRAGTMAYSVEAGPPLAADQAVTVTLRRAFLRFEEGAEPGAELVEGPWAFSVVPGPSAHDPLSRVAKVDRTVEAGGIGVTLREVRTSSDETFVLYDSSEPPTFRGLAGDPVRLVLPDGSEVRGLRRWTDPLQRKDLVVSFPPLPPGVTELQVQFGPYLLPADGGSLEISLPNLSALPPAGEQRIQLGQRFAVDGGTVEAAELNLRADGFGVVLLAPEAWQGGLAMSDQARVTAKDDRGNTYAPSTAGISADLYSIGFDSLLDPQATKLIVHVSEFGRLETGPWDFTVALPE